MGGLISDPNVDCPCLLFLCRNQFVSEYLSDTPVVSVRQPFRRRTVRLAARAFVRLMSAGASAKEKARIAKDTADNNDEVLAFAAKQTFQKQSEASPHARLHVTGVKIAVFDSIVYCCVLLFLPCV